MIQATDFVCPECKAQVGHPCQLLTPFWAHGLWKEKATELRAKPHRVRLNLAKNERKKQSHVQ